MIQKLLSWGKDYLKKCFWGTLARIRFNVREIRNVTIGIALVVGVAFCVEYFGFGNVWNEVPKEDRGVFEVVNFEGDTEDFQINDDESFVSLKEGAVLMAKTNVRYVRALRIHISENIVSSVVVEFADPHTGERISIDNDLQNFMRKKDVQVIDFLMYPVGKLPQEVVIRVDRPGVVISRVEIDNAYLFNPYRFVFFAGIGFLLLFFFLYRKKIGEKPEVGFLAVALVCGTVLSLVGPTYTYTWDEKIHYQRTEKLAFALREIEFRTGATPADYLLEEENSVNAYTEGKYKKPKKDPEIKGFLYTQLGYIPSALAITVGEILPLSHTFVFKFGRWINVFVFALVVFFAIRKLKSGKMIMVVVALLPTSLFLASNYDYDWWVTAFMMLGLAYIFSALQEPEKKITLWEMVIIIGAFVVGLGPKAIYFPLMFLMFLLPGKKFQSVGQYKKFLLAVVLSILFAVGSFLLPFLLGGPGDGDKRGGKEVNATEQVHFILSHPVAYTKILLNFMGQYVSPNNAVGYTTFFAYLGSFQGLYLAWILLLFATFTDRDSLLDCNVLTWKLRVIVFGLIFAIIALICTALYVSFTPVGERTISGVQPRYLLPVLFPFLLVVGGASFQFLRRYWVRSIIVIMSLCFSAGLFFYGVWELVILRYY